MFAVPGWKVTAALKTQSETKPKVLDQSQASVRADSLALNASKPPKKQLKRKRGANPASTNVTGDNVQDLWQSVIEGKETKRMKTKAEKIKNKRAAAKNKITNPEIQEQTATASQEETIAAKAAKKSKQRPKPSRTIQNSNALAESKSGEEHVKLTPLQASMRAKLSSARFRHLNEQLYITPSSTSFALFKETPQLFDEYHAGFRQQVQVWPENPVDSYIQEIRSRGTLRRFNANSVSKDRSNWHSTPLPRSRGGTCTIADIGCGDARLASSLQAKSQKLNIKILSFDLSSPSPLVTTADAANLPVASGTADIAIFCLALMGTNWLEFIDESWRILRPHGELWIAEIKSRFGRGVSNSSGHNTATSQTKGGQGRANGYTKGGIGTNRADVPTLSKRDRERQQAEDEAELVAKIDIPDAAGSDAVIAVEKTDVSAFVIALRRRGFALAGTERDAVDLSNKMFVKMRFTKAAEPVKGKNVSTAAAAAEMGDARTEGRRFGDRLPKKKKLKFLENAEAGDKDEDESRILKPCVYKLR